MKKVMKKFSVLSTITLLLTANFLSAGANACEEPHGKYQVSTNQNNSFFVKPDGTLWATGYNTLWGHLGDGTADTKKQTTPVKILDDVKFVAAGNSIHSLAVKNDGTVWGWGNNASGQLGSPREIKAVLSPTQVPNLTNVKTVEAGGYFSVALKNDGTVWTLGENAGGVLGVPDTEVPKSYSPIPVETLSDISAISSGSYHTMALKSDGTVWTWGKNSTGQIGVSKDVQMTGVPVQVEGLSNVVAVSAGREFSLVLKDDGTVWGWGKNSDLFGASVVGNTYAPVQIEGLENVTYIEAGTAHSFAKKSDGTVWGWGANGVGQLGNGAKTSTAVPIEIENLFNFESLSAGTNVSLGVKADGTVWSWGYNDHGELGIGNTNYKTAPVQVTLQLSAGTNACEEPHGKYQVSTNQNNSFFVKPDGTLWATGYNTLWGHLGDGTADTKKQTTPVKILDDVKFVAAGNSIHSLAVKNDGTVWGWGNNASGQLGSPREIKAVLSPTQVPNLTNVKTVEAGGYFSVALKNDGTVWTLGENAGGVLGVPDTEVPKSYSPIPVETLSDISAISSGSYHTMALKSDGTVWTWGKNSTGQIGVSKDVQMTGVPVQVEGLSNVVAVSAGREFSLVLKDDGTVWGWGKNSDLFGASVVGNTYAPVQIEGLENVTYIEAGTAHSFAKKSDGTVWGWGANGVGQLGNGAKTSTAVPIEIENLFNFESLSAGTNVSLGVKSDGTVWSWGYNDHGELGIGHTNYKTSPVQVTLN